MLPVALTCPVWWVARWMARVVTSLAVVLACSLGAAPTPAGAASSASAPSVSGDPADHRSHVSWPAAVPPAGSPAALALTVRAASGFPEIVVVDRSALSAGVSVPAAPQSAGVVPAGRQRALVGLTPATHGSRAPPAH